MPITYNVIHLQFWMKLLPNNWCALLICTHFVFFCAAWIGPATVYCSMSRRRGPENWEILLGINISLASCRDNVRKASKLLGEKETEHKWSCTTPMSWPKKVIKKAFGHHRGCIVKHFPPYLMWKKILDALFFPARLSVVEKLRQNTVSLNFPAFFQVEAGNTVISIRAWRDNVLSIYKKPVSYVSNNL